MRETRRKSFFARVDILLLGISAAFLMSTVLRICGTDEFDRIRKETANFVLGELSAEQLVQTMGSWEKTDELIAAALQSEF